MGIPVTVAVAERIRELYAEAQRLLLMGEANAATRLRDEAYQLERQAAAEGR